MCRAASASRNASRNMLLTLHTSGSGSLDGRVAALEPHVSEDRTPRGISGHSGSPQRHEYARAHNPTIPDATSGGLTTHSGRVRCPAPGQRETNGHEIPIAAESVFETVTWLRLWDARLDTCFDGHMISARDGHISDREYAHPVIGRIRLSNVSNCLIPLEFRTYLSDPPESEISLDHRPLSSSVQQPFYWQDGIPHRIPTLRRCSLPLAPVAPPDFDYGALRKLFDEVPPDAQLLRLLSYLSTEHLARKLEDYVRNEDVSYRALTSKPISGLSQLTDTGTIEEADYSYLVSKVFTVPKSDNQSSRFVFDGRVFDEIFKASVGEPPETPLPLITEVVQEILSGWSVVSTIDAKSMFYQFRIHRRLRKWTSFRVEDDPRTFRLTVLPMGVCFAPAWAQRLMLFLTQVVRRRNPDVEFGTVVWIDNVILLTRDPRDDEIIRLQFDRLFAEVKLQMKGWEGGHGTSDILGISFDLTRRIAQPTEQKKLAIRRIAEELTSTWLCDFRSYLSWFGLAQWMSYTTARFPLCFCPTVMLRIRSVCAAQDWKSFLRITTAEQGEIMRLTAAVISSSCGPAPNPPRGPRVSTDASTAALAGLDEVSRSGWTIPLEVSSRAIAAAEMLAGFISAQVLGAGRSFMWAVDNRPAYHAIQKGHSASSLGDEILRRWFTFGNLPAAIQWVPSACQLADPLTRVDQYPPNHYDACRHDHPSTVTRWRIPPASA